MKPLASSSSPARLNRRSVAIASHSRIAKLPRTSSASSKPPLPARPSISRRSSVIYGKGTQPRSDPRPLNEKPFQTSSVRRIVEYLSSHGYGFPISSKSLPSGKDIHNMIEFLFRQIEPSFRLVKLEDDVPFFFRSVGYPCQISKSALYAPGSPHSWPNLLAALVWLVDYLNCEEEEVRDGTVDDESSEHLIEFLVQSYTYFMAGDDETVEGLDEQIREQNARENEEIDRCAEGFTRQIEEAEAELKSLTSEPDPVLVLENKKSNLISDVGKFKTLIQNQATLKTSIEKKLEQQKRLSEAKNAEVARATEENKALAESITAQSVNVEGFEKMTRELQRVENELQSLFTSTKEREKEIEDMEVVVSTYLKKLESSAGESNEVARRLRLDNSFENSLNPGGETAHDVLGVDIKTSLRPQLAVLLEAEEKSLLEVQKEATEMLILMHEKEKETQENRSALAQLESKVKKLDDMLKERQAELEAILAQSETIRTQILEGDKKLKVAQRDTAEKLERAKQDSEKLASTCESEIEQARSELVAVTEKLVSFVEQIREGNARVKNEVDQLSDSMAKNFIIKKMQLQL